MKAKLILAAGWLALMYEESKAEKHREFLESALGVEYEDILIMVRSGTTEVPLPDPDTDPSDWEELRHFLKASTGLTLVFVIGPDGPLYLVLRGEVAFAVCKSGPHTWVPLITEAIEKNRTNATTEYDQLMGRITK